MLLGNIMFAVLMSDERSRPTNRPSRKLRNIDDVQFAEL